MILFSFSKSEKLNEKTMNVMKSTTLIKFQKYFGNWNCGGISVVSFTETSLIYSKFQRKTSLPCKCKPYRRLLKLFLLQTLAMPRKFRTLREFLEKYLNKLYTLHAKTDTSELL